MRYSVPHRLIRDRVEVAVDEQTVRVFHGATLVATHARVREPFARVVDATHYAGLWRQPGTATAIAPTLAPLGRQLAEYAAAIAGGAQ